jgi:hypothetical protein
MSRIDYDPQSLTDIIEESNLIVEVQYVGDFTDEIVVKDAASKKPVPPFIKSGYVFRVTHILKNDTNTQIPQTIQVPDENWRRSLSQHKAAHAGGPDKSFTVKEYDTEAASLQEATVLFLHHFQGMFELSAKGSYETDDIMGKLEPLLKQDQKKFK